MALEVDISFLSAIYNRIIVNITAGHTTSRRWWCGFQSKLVEDLPTAFKQIIFGCVFNLSLQILQNRSWPAQVYSVVTILWRVLFEFLRSFGSKSTNKSVEEVDFSVSACDRQFDRFAVNATTEWTTCRWLRCGLQSNRGEDMLRIHKQIIFWWRSNSALQIP